MTGHAGPACAHVRHEPGKWAVREHGLQGGL